MRHIFRIILAGLALVVIALLSALITMRLAIHGAEVRIPNLSGLTIAQALEQTRTRGLELSVADHFYSATTPAGHILVQRPQAGTLVRRSWHVRVTESLGPQNVTIPNITGMDARLATITIRRSGLQLGNITSLPYANALAGTVIAQSPMEHAKAVERPRVDILLAAPASETASAYVMPNLTGESFTAAALAVMHAGFKLAPIEETNTAIPPVPQIGTTSAPPQPPVPSGTVIAQIPEADSRVIAGATIQLIVQH
ncbi:MAG TPA: PASTA domain-containing protein [Acidobacteriaceae bacterium]|nr:PASTA domain-containing protein [Acidobacteriaceae bacterium]